MQFEWWRKREEKREPAIRLVRDSSSGEGGGGGVRSLHFCFGMVLSGADGGLFREFRPAYSEEYARIASIFPIGEKCRNWNGISKLSSFFFFLSRLLSSSRSGYISPRHCVHCVDRSTIPRDISSSSSFFLLRLASQFASSFDIRHFIIVSFLFFLLDLRILSSSRYFIKFCIVFHTVFFSIKKKKKNTDGRKIYST